ncbi:M20/M25/M40 family metallo-hydrolase [Salirhabdus sp. Marseille-P4669]|uniref:M20/M25/M40 family metallo-hydrolase n=1 Tax=Salirhabdus sp. Marseille-P4669 TaxID=2042310 RepID=UPI000C7A99B0|nr:M20/M25/M40 family metallo-hydrolase [Salirhabdus sp. Marseille-P4669]
MKWQSKEQLTNLLCSLIEIPSITGTDGEIEIVQYMHHLLSEYEYFQANPTHLALQPLKDGRQLLTAFVRKNPSVKDTIILLGHVDVVDVEDYGSFVNLAFHPKQLTETFKRDPHLLPKEVQEDLQKGDWLFGRGSMDMKAGITLNLSLLEAAIHGEFDGNVLLVAVPDEEANSSGMLEVLPVLKRFEQQFNINYITCLQTEPVFRKFPGEENLYMYTGSIGKLLPGFYCYGKETHVGEPFAGVNANVMISYLNQELELHEDFIEKVAEETTPPPISLMNRDLKEEYSVQTPISAIAMYNLLYMKQGIKEITDKLVQAAKRATTHIEEHYQQKAAIYSAHSGIEYDANVRVNILLYEELYEKAVERVGEQEVLRRQNLLISNRNHGDRDFSTILVQDLANLCKDLAPMIVLFYSPPFYPAVSSNNHPLIQQVTNDIQHYVKEDMHLHLQKVQFFPGLSDLSFIGPKTSTEGIDLLQQNMPLDEKGYILRDVDNPITVPILNIGPYGKDAHQWTERLELTYSFETLPTILRRTIHAIFSYGKNDKNEN